MYLNGDYNSRSVSPAITLNVIVATFSSSIIMFPVYAGIFNIDLTVNYILLLGEAQLIKLRKYQTRQPTHITITGLMTPFVIFTKQTIPIFTL